MQSSTANLKNWLGLYHSEGVTPLQFRRYLQCDPDLNDLPDKLSVNWFAVQRDLDWLQKTKAAAIITLNDARYPAQLKQIPAPPPILYVLGNYAFLKTMQLAIVGSRNPSAQGLTHATEFAAKLIEYGFTITSGMALGVDAASHKGALQANGATIAVLGNGLDTFYPLRNAALAVQILEHGCIVSEFPIGTVPTPYNFPRRNRIISGLSVGVLVVEAAVKSGSLITADFALEQGREVFAIPGSINSSKVKGCHALIRSGAKLVDCVTDILDELAPLLQLDFRGRNAASGQNKLSRAGLSAGQQLILDHIDQDSTCVDLIVDRTGVATSVAGAILLELELQGLVAAVPGGYTRRDISY